MNTGINMSATAIRAITPVGSNFIDEFATALASMLGKLEGAGFSDSGKESAAAAERAADADADHKARKAANFWFGAGGRMSGRFRQKFSDVVISECAGWHLHV